MDKIKNYVLVIFMISGWMNVGITAKPASTNVTNCVYLRIADEGMNGFMMQQEWS